jgi:membrane protease subunit (stomatin/prohibitin family)
MDMSFFSRSSKGSNYKNENYGSGHYKKKGMLGNLFNMIGSKSGSGGNYNNDRNQYNNTPMQNQSSSNQGAVNCSKCGSQIPAGSKFCLECGNKVQDAFSCTGCGEKLPPNSKFCLKCGTKVNG